MCGKKSGLSTRVKNDYPKALPSHCLGHSLNLSLRNVNNVSKLMRNTMDTISEISILVKYSPKRENILETMKLGEYIEARNISEENAQSPPGKVQQFSFTRWTVRNRAFKAIRENYVYLLQLFEYCLDAERNMEAKMKARILGCKTQMETFDFFFGLQIGIDIYSMTEGLSKTLQGQKVSLLDGTRIALNVVKCLQNIRTDEAFNLFFEKVKKHKEEIPDIEDPKLPRKKRNRHNYASLHSHFQVDGRTTTGMLSVFKR